jgi:Tfp pilus assembly protein PilN
MLQKPFISVVFSSQNIQFVKLDSSKKAVAKMGSFPIPKGTIVSRQIKSPQVLIQTITQAIKSLGIKEKSAGIVIPEFSTFTRQMRLPKLPISELDEAVRWQSNDYLSSLGDQIILDWEITSQTNEEYNILAVAIQTNVLSSYVDVVSRAGLLPLVVETPSLALSRISDGTDKGRLIIYVSHDETILVISQGHSIVASSVASSNSQDEIIKTAIRMLNHYQDIPVYKVVLGGINISQQFLKDISQYTQRPVEMASTAIPGLDPHKTQEYLIALSLQLKKPNPPEDTKTVNLLPPTWASHYKKQSIHKAYQSLSLLASFTIWAIFLTTLTIYAIFSQKLSNIQDQLANGTNSSLTEIIDKTNKVNSLSKSIIDVNSKSLSPQQLINQIASKAPSSLRLTYFELNLEKGEIEISGFSPNRKSLLSFKETLLESESIQKVDIPITYLALEDNIDFSLVISLESEQKDSPPKLKL